MTKTTNPPIVHQYAHETWDQAFHRRQAENLARVDAAIKTLNEIKERDRKIGQDMLMAFTTLGMGLNKTLEKL